MTQARRKAVIAYKSTITVFKKWLADGQISLPDYNRIEQIMAEKYGLSSYSVWRELA